MISLPMLHMLDFRVFSLALLGEAYVQFINVQDRDRLIRESPIPFDDVIVSFTKHNEGVNWRRAHFNHECWLMLVGVPLDHWNTEDLLAAFNKIGNY
jgi:hypothetical protein